MRVDCQSAVESISLEERLSRKVHRGLWYVRISVQIVVFCILDLLADNPTRIVAESVESKFLQPLRRDLIRRQKHVSRDA